MARYTPTGTVRSIPALNAELEKISEAFDGTLSREGDVPNQMEADLDMNGNEILNVVTDPNNPDSLVSRRDVYLQSEVDTKDATVLSQAQEYADAAANGVATSVVRYVQEDLPTPPILTGARWYKPSDGITYVYYVDGDSSQWVQETVNSFEGTLRDELADANSDVLVGGVEASKVSHRESHIQDFNAAGDGVTDDTAAFTTNPELFKYVPDGTYLLSGASVTLDPLKIKGTGLLKTEDVGSTVLSVGGGDRLSGAFVDGLRFQQPNDPTMSGGTANNYFALKLFATDDSRLSNLSFENVDLCLGFEYGAIALGDRSCFRNVVNNVVGYGVRGMGLQLFGSKLGSFTNLSFEGTNLAGDAGARAQFHGLRLNALTSSVNQGNRVQLVAKNFSNGVSLQQNSYFNVVDIYAENCTNGVFTHGQNEGVSSGVSTDNTFNISADGCEYAVYEGGSHNTYNIKASGCTVGGIFSDSGGGDPLLGVNNTYNGSIKNTVGRLADIRSTDSTIHLNLRGVGAASTFGLILQGNGCSGNADVRSCNVGVSITGDDNLMSLSIRDSVGDDLQISGSNNVVTVNCQGNVTLTGNNNVLLGRVGGTITDLGVGNTLPA